MSLSLPRQNVWSWWFMTEHRFIAPDWAKPKLEAWVGIFTHPKKTQNLQLNLAYQNCKYLHVEYKSARNGCKSFHIFSKIQSYYSYMSSYTRST